MKNLLDTHTVLWFLNGKALSAKTKELIVNCENYISVVTLWEIAIKMRQVYFRRWVFIIQRACEK